MVCKTLLRFSFVRCHEQLRLQKSTPHPVGALSSITPEETSPGPRGRMPPTIAVPNAPPRRLKVEDALAYLDLVKMRYRHVPAPEPTS